MFGDLNLSFLKRDKNTTAQTSGSPRPLPQHTKPAVGAVPSLDVPVFQKSNYSAKRQLKPVNFICRVTSAQSVSLIGNFNNWDPAAHPMERQPDGCWKLVVDLHHGPCEYAFNIDGVLVNDPAAQGICDRGDGVKVSFKPVS